MIDEPKYANGGFVTADFNIGSPLVHNDYFIPTPLSEKLKSNTKSMIGIIPAAGRGTRAGGLPYPKELLPVRAENGKMITVIEGAIQQLANAEIDQAVIVIRPEKQVIADYLGNERFGVNLMYRYQETMNSREGLPDAVLAGHVSAVPLYVMLMGDVYFTDPYVTRSLVIAMQYQLRAIAGVSLWKTSEPQRFGIVQRSEHWVGAVIDKPSFVGTYEHWGAVAFRGAFWEFLRTETGTFSAALDRAALYSDVLGIPAQGSYLDYGTPEAIINNIKVANS